MWCRNEKNLIKVGDKHTQNLFKKDSYPINLSLENSCQTTLGYILKVKHSVSSMCINYPWVILQGLTSKECLFFK